MLLDAGARLAKPGEFTLRAFLRGRIDLVQAEAIHDLIEAQTLFQAKIANQQACGSLSRRLKPIKDQLVQLISLLEASIDFAEDDISLPNQTEVALHLEEIRLQLERLRATFTLGKIVNAGLTVAIVGRPNVGKSSVFNALLREDRAIVTEVPGTTRDLISETTQIDGIPIRLFDTAGIRQADDRVERMGIDRSVAALTDADRVLFVVDTSEPLKAEDFEIAQQLENSRWMLVANKIDLPNQADIQSINTLHRVVTWVSAKTGLGMDELRSSLLEQSRCASLLDADCGLVTNIRHERLLGESIYSLSNSINSHSWGMPDEVVLLDLYGALKALNVLTGETTIEDILGNIFSTFCIGK
jgi:tRNA modification GTPase